FVTEGAFAYVAADWRRVLVVAIVVLVGTLTVVAAQRNAPFTRRTSHHPRWFFLFGVVGGGVVGLFDIGTASLLWHLHGEPDGYFRGGWAGVVTSALLAMTFGCGA